MITVTIDKFIKDDVLDSWFGYHPPSTPEVLAAHTTIREEFKKLARTLSDLLPEGPDKTVTLRAVREAMYHANACVAVAQDIYRAPL